MYLPRVPCMAVTHVSIPCMAISHMVHTKLYNMYVLHHEKHGPLKCITEMHCSFSCGLMRQHVCKNEVIIEWYRTCLMIINKHRLSEPRTTIHP